MRDEEEGIGDSPSPGAVDVKPIVMRSDGTIAPEEFTEEELEFFLGWQPSTKVTRKDIEESVRVGTPKPGRFRSSASSTPGGS